MLLSSSNNERSSEGKVKAMQDKTLEKEYLIAPFDFWRRDMRDSTNMETRGSLFAMFSRIKMNWTG